MGAEKVRLFLDQDSGMRAATLGAFAERVADRTADAFYVRINKDMTVDERKHALKDSRERCRALEDEHPTLDRSQIAEFTDGCLQVFARRAGRTFSAVVDVFPAGEEKYIAYGNTPEEFRLLPGTYTIRCKDRNVLEETVGWMREVKVKAGDKNTIHVDF
jgi:hypothetical protein